MAPAFDRVVAVWDSSGASTGTACLGRSVRGSPGIVDYFLLFSFKLNNMIGSLNFTLVYDHTTVKSLDLV